MVRKLGAPCPFGEGKLGPHLTQCRLGWGLPSCQLASWSIQPFAHNRYGPQIGGFAPFWGRGGGSPSNAVWPGPRPTYMLSLSWSIQPFGHNTATSQTDKQRFDSIGRTVSQTVAHKWLNWSICHLVCGLGWAKGSRSSIVFTRRRECALVGELIGEYN